MHVLRTDDCVVAISSPVGRSIRGILRVTGPEAVGVCGRLFEPADSRPLGLQPAWRFVAGWLRLEQDVPVPCNAVVFLPPRSYTGQPLVELHLAGSPAVLEMALRALTAAGARPAEPGEFTARAFLTGRMDLVSAEAVAERIAARSDAQLTAAQQLAGGTLAEQIGAAVDELTELLSLVEAGIDFADEPIEFIDAGSLTRRLAALQGSLQDLLARSVDMQRLEVLPRVALVGPMSAGKSSLVNRLSGLDRSICSPIPGTTRDVLSAVMNTPAGQVLLLDGPGLGTPRSEIDHLAQTAWRELLGHVDLALVVLPADQLYDMWFRPADDGSVGAAPQEVKATLEAVAGRSYLVVLNKQDLLDAAQRADVQGAMPLLFASCAALAKQDAGVPVAVHMISAATGTGCEELRAAMGSAVAGMSTTGQGRIVLTARHSQALQAGLEAVAAAIGLVVEQRGQPPEQPKGPDPGLPAEAFFPAELVALHLRDAVGHLGQITGSVTTEDLLERVFSRFCIGK